MDLRNLLAGDFARDGADVRTAGDSCFDRPSGSGCNGLRAVSVS